MSAMASGCSRPSLRAWLGRLRDEDLLAVITRRVDTRFEMAAVTRLLDGRRAALFTRPGDANVFIDGHQRGPSGVHIQRM